MSEMFSYASAFNQPIGNWNVNKVTNMDTMFMFATAFNQNLSKWCVTNIPTQPANFALDAFAGWRSDSVRHPQWGFCPDPSSLNCWDAADISVGQHVIQACNVGAVFVGTGQLSY